MSAQFVRSALAASLVAGAVSSALAAAPTVSTFDTDTQSFIQSTIGTTVIQQGTGGNPDGHLTLRRDTGAALDLAAVNSSSPEYVGSYAAEGINGAGFDINVGNFSLDALWIRIRESSFINGWHYDFGPLAANGNAWVPKDVAFDPTWNDATATLNGWVKEDAGVGSFATTFSNVHWFEIRTIKAPNDTSLIVELDNVRLVPAPGAAGLALMGMGAAARRRRR